MEDLKMQMETFGEEINQDMEDLIGMLNTQTVAIPTLMMMGI